MYICNICNIGPYEDKPSKRYSSYTNRVRFFFFDASKFVFHWSSHVLFFGLILGSYCKTNGILGSLLYCTSASTTLRPNLRHGAFTVISGPRSDMRHASRAYFNGAKGKKLRVIPHVYSAYVCITVTPLPHLDFFKVIFESKPEMHPTVSHAYILEMSIQRN